jgi:hypothetical protein
VPHQVNRTFTDGLPVRNLNCILHYVDFDQRSGRNQLAHSVIFEAYDGVAVSSGIETFAQGRRKTGQLLRVQFEQAGLVTVEVGVEVQLKAETRFPNLRGLKPRQAWFNLAGILPYIIHVNPENEEELLQGNFETGG